MQNSTAFQIVSIEPTQPLVQVVNQTDERHALEVNSGDSRQFNAPVCGIEYHVQEVHLFGKEDGTDTMLAIENCLEEIKTLTEQMFADGYIEVL